MAIFTIALLSTVIWALLLIPYLLWLRKTTFFKAQRFYLLSALGLGLVLSVWRVLGESMGMSLKTNLTGPLHLFSSDSGFFKQINEGLFANEIVINLSNTKWQIGLYFIVSAILIALLIYKVLDIVMVIRGNLVQKRGDMHIVKSPNRHTPFSFFNYIFFSKEYKADPEDEAAILKHESVHTSQWHSLDILFVELMFAFTWFLPIVYLYKKELVMVHEYLADKEVTLTIDKKVYGRMLIAHQLGEGLALSHNFSTSELKNRFLKLAQKPSPKSHLSSILLILPICLMCYSGLEALDLRKIFTNKIWRDLETNTTTREINLGNSDLKLVEDKPYLESMEATFPGGSAALTEFLATHIKTGAGETQNTYVKLIIDEDGHVEDVKFLGLVTEEFIENFREIVSKMPEWVAARENGQKKKSEVTLNIIFQQ